MKIFTKQDCIKNKELILKKIQKGEIFIYPTDTIYGIGCNALNCVSVEKIKKIKKRQAKPFSVIAPSKKWIHDNCYTDKEIIKHINKLPDKLTLILKLKNKKCICKKVNNNLETLGIRIPKNWFFKFVKSINIPIVTTSVNKTKENYMTCINNLNKEIKSQVDFIIYDGELKSSPSKIIDLIKKIKIKRQ
jgi:tRNA threonylcarbamoyl adenosine modification protein (Sua5/YciO/YrdC/YwlC family)